MRTLIAVPVYNEAATLERVLRRIRHYAEEILVLDDGSTDETPALLAELRPRLGFDLIQREQNAGYGRTVRDAFRRAAERGFDWVITIDCDEQHEPSSIPAMLARAAADDLDLVSGTRYANEPDPADPLAAPPADRRRINRLITEELNERLGLSLTDAFCGFKAHRVAPAAALGLTEEGYAFPMQLWVRAVAAGLRIGEVPVRLIYNDPNRTFGGGLDDAERRLAHYREVLHTELCRCADRLPCGAARELVVDCDAC